MRARPQEQVEEKAMKTSVKIPAPYGSVYLPVISSFDGPAVVKLSTVWRLIDMVVSSRKHNCGRPVRLADTSSTFQKGLMDVRHLVPGEGLLLKTAVDPQLFFMKFRL